MQAQSSLLFVFVGNVLGDFEADNPLEDGDAEGGGRQVEVAHATAGSLLHERRPVERRIRLQTARHVQG